MPTYPPFCFRHARDHDSLAHENHPRARAENKKDKSGGHRRYKQATPSGGFDGHPLPRPCDIDHPRPEVDIKPFTPTNVSANMAPMRAPLSQLLTFLLLFGRYVAAIGVSYIVSFAVFFSGMFVLLWAGLVGFVLLFIACGFSGVFVGASCLPRSNRLFGSAILLLLGLAYYTYFVMSVDPVRAENNKFPYVWISPLALGGVLAMVLIRKKSRTKALDATPARPSS